MTHPAVPDHSDYYRAVSAEDVRLCDTLAAIRADTEAGHLTTREAADNRIVVLETHLRKCQELRQQWLGDTSP